MDLVWFLCDTGVFNNLDIILETGKRYDIFLTFQHLLSACVYLNVSSNTVHTRIHPSKNSSKL